MTTLYEKSNSVLWALMDDGIVLHNFDRREYLELHGPEQLVWAYFDGTHAVHDVEERVRDAAGDAAGGAAPLVQETFRRLLAGGFLAVREAP